MIGNWEKLLLNDLNDAAQFAQFHKDAVESDTNISISAFHEGQLNEQGHKHEDLYRKILIGRKSCFYGREVCVWNNKTIRLDWLRPANEKVSFHIKYDRIGRVI